MRLFTAEIVYKSDGEFKTDDIVVYPVDEHGDPVNWSRRFADRNNPNNIFNLEDLVGLKAL